MIPGRTLPEILSDNNRALKKRKQIIEEREENPNEPFECDGVLIQYIPFYTDRRTDRTHCKFFPDGVIFATEMVYHAWARTPEITHDVWLDCSSKERAEEILRLAGVDGGASEHPYAEGRWYVTVGSDIADVVKIWKIVKPEEIIPDIE